MNLAFILVSLKQVAQCFEKIYYTGDRVVHVHLVHFIG